MSAERWIVHLDMDAFYASVELLRHPQLRGRPVVVGGRRTAAGEAAPAAGWPRLRDYAGRGVVTTATYEARALGVHSGMGLMRAARLAPEAVLLPADFGEYSRLSRLFKDAVRAIAPLVEDRGIDEIYVDLSPLVAERADPGDRARAAQALARRLQEAVRAATGLSCSIGLTPNKLLSKIASDLDKPGGLTVLAAAEVPARIWPLPVGRISGIGPKAAARLAGLGIRRIGELAGADAALLAEHFGSACAAWLHASAAGRDDRPVVTTSEPRSVSRETTFERDLDARADRAALSRIFTGLCENLAADLRRRGYRGRSIGLKLRYEDFRTVTREQRLAGPTDDAAAIRRAAGQCLKRVPLTRRIRLLGVRAGSLVPANASFEQPAAGSAAPQDHHTLPLFGD